jgi:hypothetical protein
VEHD